MNSFVEFLKKIPAVVTEIIAEDPRRRSRFEENLQKATRNPELVEWELWYYNISLAPWPKPTKTDFTEAEFTLAACHILAFLHDTIPNSDPAIRFFEYNTGDVLFLDNLCAAAPDFRLLGKIWPKQPERTKAAIKALIEKEDVFFIKNAIESASDERIYSTNEAHYFEVESRLQRAISAAKADLDKAGAKTTKKIDGEWSKPTDLIRSCVAIKRYAVSRSTLQRAVEDGRLKSYRPPDATKNSPHLFSEKEIACLWPNR